MGILCDPASSCTATHGRRPASAPQSFATVTVCIPGDRLAQSVCTTDTHLRSVSAEMTFLCAVAGMIRSDLSNNFSCFPLQCLHVTHLEYARTREHTAQARAIADGTKPQANDLVCCFQSSCS
eukprot:988090-Amphidinium_carterae.1